MGSEENVADSTIPSWINSEFLAEILSEDLKKGVSITNFSVERAVPKGENYLSVLHRVMVEYKNNKDANDIEKYFLIIKSIPEGELFQKIITELQVFQKESFMYKDVLPAMYRIMTTAKGKICPLSPRCLLCARENVIVLEDLKHLDYKMAVRKEGLDLDHCKIAIRTLARFHAASVALYKINPSIMDRYEEVLYVDYEDEEKRRKSIRNYKKSFNHLASTVEKWPGYEKYGEKLRKLIPTSRERMIEIVKPKKNSFNVLNHGDCWVNNMLFRYSRETGKVEDMRYIDYQIARYSSPALDLQYFICNSPNDEVRFEHKDTLLEEYYSELADYCKAMNLDSELISLEQLKEEFEEKNFFGLVTACSVLCIILAEADDMPDTEELKEDDFDNDDATFTKDAVSGKRFREIFQKLLVYYDKKGVF